MIFLKLFCTFLKIGAFTFGGGYAMIPLIQSDVIKHGWMQMTDLVNFIAVSESTPGPFAVNVSTYIGMKTGGLFGAFCATFGVVLPSFIIILIVARCYLKFKNSRTVKNAMYILKPAVAGLIAAATISVAKSAFSHFGLNLKTLCAAILFALCLFASKKKINPIITIVGCAVIGIALGYLKVIS